MAHKTRICYEEWKKEAVGVFIKLDFDFGKLDWWFLVGPSFLLYECT